MTALALLGRLRGHSDCHVSCFLLQQPISCSFHQQQVAGALPNVALPHLLDFVSVELNFLFTQQRVRPWLKQTGIEGLGLSGCFQVLSQLPTLKNRSDFGHEVRNLRSKVSIGLGNLEEIQELFADQVIQGLLRPKFTFDVFGRLALLDPNPVWFYFGISEGFGRYWRRSTDLS